MPPHRRIGLLGKACATCCWYEWEKRATAPWPHYNSREDRSGRVQHSRAIACHHQPVRWTVARNPKHHDLLAPPRYAPLLLRLHERLLGGGVSFYKFQFFFRPWRWGNVHDELPYGPLHYYQKFLHIAHTQKNPALYRARWCCLFWSRKMNFCSKARSSHTHSDETPSTFGVGVFKFCWRPSGQTEKNDIPTTGNR